MCGCFAVVLGAAFPRITLLLIWIFTPYVGEAFARNWILPIAGILLLPYTTLAYVLVYWFSGAVTGFGWAFVVLGLFFDLGSYAAAGQNRRASA